MAFARPYNALGRVLAFEGTARDGLQLQSSARNFSEVQAVQFWAGQAGETAFAAGRAAAVLAPRALARSHLPCTLCPAKMKTASLYKLSFHKELRKQRGHLDGSYTC